MDNKNSLHHVFYHYGKQCWFKNGRVEKCHHPEEMECSCYGKLHEGETDKNYELYLDGMITLDEFNKRMFY